MQAKRSANTEYIGVRVPHHVAQKIRAEAARSRMSVSQMLRIFLLKGDNHLFSRKRASA